MGRWGDGKMGRFLFRVIILTKTMGFKPRPSRTAFPESIQQKVYTLLSV
ncbi:hypothetical protein [Moorena producens]|nr:hypothetical protein [Moorena producens]